MQGMTPALTLARIHGTWNLILWANSVIVNNLSSSLVTYHFKESPDAPDIPQPSGDGCG